MMIGQADHLDYDQVVEGEKWDEVEIGRRLPNNLIARDYQASIFDAFLKCHFDWRNKKEELEIQGYSPACVIEAIGSEPSWRKGGVQVLHRRAGKDIGALHLIAQAAMMRVGTYWHILPYKTQARVAIWDGLDKNGIRFIKNAFPDQIVASINESRMQVKFINGSVYQLQGADSDKLVGSGVVGVVYSESSLMSPKVRSYIRPMLSETEGWELHIATPRGKNWFHDLAMKASGHPELAAKQTKGISDKGESFTSWYYDYLTIEDTWRWAFVSSVPEGYISDGKRKEHGLTREELPVYEMVETEIKGLDTLAKIQKKKESGEIVDRVKVRVIPKQEALDAIAEGIDEAIVKQEYYCDWDQALLGAYYGDQMTKMDKEGRIGSYPHNPNRPVYVHADLGFSDATSITFSQESPLGYPVVIRHDVGSGKSMLEWIRHIEEVANQERYRIGLIVLPHDADQTDVSTGMTRFEYCMQEGQFDKRGLEFDILKQESIDTGIELVRGALNSGLCIDRSCYDLIEALKSYRRQWDEVNQTYKPKPVHDWASHPADNMRYLVSSWRATVNHYGYHSDTSRGNAIKKRIKVKRAIH